MKENKRFKVVLETKSPFRIGGQKDPFSKADQPIAKIGGRIIVQGTSLKGAYRQGIEDYLIENYFDNDSMKPCVPSDKKNISKDEEKLISDGKYKGMSCHYPCDVKTDPQDKRVHRCGDSPHSICPACYLLGAQGLVGFVTVPFLNANVTPNDLYSIRIDRAKGTAASGTNREYQIIPEGVKFEGELTVLMKDDVRGWELGKPRDLQDSTKGDMWLHETSWNGDRILKELVVERLEAIDVMGGLRSSGAGKVKITVQEIK